MSSLVPWPKPVVESHGDYERDAFLELPGRPLYQHQASLPRLPVPSLQDTVDRFLPTALPLVETKEEEVSLRQACQEFPKQAQRFQNRLLEKASCNSSWLQLWWNQLGYLQYRDPVVINVSYFFNLPDDPSLSRANEKQQVQRGAALLKAAWEYRQLVCSGDLPQETIGKNKTPLCSVGFKYLFHSCRMPRDKEDSYKLYDPSVYTHAIVAVRGQFFTLPMVDDDGKAYALQAMEAALEQCIDKAKESSLDLGLLTTANRDKCTHSREELLRVGGPPMEKAFEKLESGMLLLCLDEEEPYSYQQAARHYWHGNGSSNRWYDKNIQLVVTKNGKFGYVGEHAMMDGMPAVGLCRHLLERNHGKLQSENTVTNSSVPMIESIFEPVLQTLAAKDQSDLDRLVEEARSDFLEVVDSNDMHVQTFQGYGTEFIKSAGFSPDAYIQMAIQLATFRLFGTQAATYESTQVRPFLHGRTETTRTVSPASNAFCRVMGLRPIGDHHDAKARTEKLTLLKEATESHVKYIRLASQAQGVDRHLMGLGLAAEEGEDLPDLLLHPLHARSKLWRVSTSTLPGTSPGFGPVCDTGVGIGYDVRATSCTFSVSALKHRAWTEELSHYLEEALLEMRELSEMERAARSKL
jgi:carnitine O-acetyltransferase